MIQAIHLTKCYATVATQREQLLTAQEKHVAENRRLSGELGSAKTALLKAESDHNEASRKVESLEKSAKARKTQLNSIHKEKEELEQKNAKLSEKLKDTRRHVIKDFMASNQFSKMSTTWFYDGFVKCKRICTKNFPSIDFAAIEPEDDTASMMEVGDDPEDDASSDPAVETSRGEDLGGKPQTKPAGGQTAIPSSKPSSSNVIHPKANPTQP